MLRLMCISETRRYVGHVYADPKRALNMFVESTDWVYERQSVQEETNEWNTKKISTANVQQMRMIHTFE